MNIVLAGMPGSGKTTIAKQFEKLGRTVVDTDELIVKKHGAVTEIFAHYGEQYFRRLETEAVREASSLDGVVIATGGGCLLKEENVGLFKKSGKIIFLRTRVQTIFVRIAGDTSRPLLLGDLRGKLETLYLERTPVYERAADFIIDTDELTPEEIINKITEYTT